MTPRVIAACNQQIAQQLVDLFKKADSEIVNKNLKWSVLTCTHILIRRMYILYNLYYIIMHMSLYADLKTQYYLMQLEKAAFIIKIVY